MEENPFAIESLGPCRVDSPLPLSSDYTNSKAFHFTPEDSIVLHEAMISSIHPQPPHAFEAAGPRAKIYFDPSKTRAGIVTCGGLCPGINNVIRSIVMQLTYSYGVRQIYGFRYGYEGFIAKYGHDMVQLTPEKVSGLHAEGGTMLGSSRGAQDVGEIVDCLDRHNIKILFCIGGDGTLRGASKIAEEVKARGLKIAVVGIPKTIDNDIQFCLKTFGFETAFAMAVESIRSAHVESYGAPYGIGLVKLMGRDSGFIAANTVLACPDVNYVLVPEVPFELEGENGFLREIEKRMNKLKDQKRHPHAVIVVAEGAGQHFFQRTGETDASGNMRYGDVGLFLKEKIQSYFKGKLPINLKYIEPSYMIRSVPANAHDAIFCYYLADHAVHAGMAGKTNMMIGYWNGRFTHVPLKEVSKHRKRIDPASELWRQVLFATGQPSQML